MADEGQIDRLKDVAAWNTWRQEHPDERPDLKAADLGGANLAGANLAGANLAGANLAGANLAGANLAGANLAGANLAGANLAGANLAGANPAGWASADEDLAEANLDEPEAVQEAEAERATQEEGVTPGSGVPGIESQAGGGGNRVGGGEGGDIPSGWYPDPSGGHGLRYWDGIVWTEHTSTPGDVYTDPPKADSPVAPVAVAAESAAESRSDEATLRRLPGAGGRQRVGSKICLSCGELNPMTRTHCTRCASELDPKPVPVIDDVEFTITTPPTTLPGNSAVLDLWVHLESGLDEVLERAARNAGPEGVTDRTFVGPSVERGAVIVAALSMPDFTVQFPENQILWNGRLAQASFTFSVSPELMAGQYPAQLTLHVNGLCIAMLNFTVAVAEAAERSSFSVKPYRSVFASYSSEDRDAVLGRVQGMQKVMPDIDVFVDVATLRSGDKWQERIRTEIESSDAFYLFWSEAASKSEWVEREWRIALQKPGLDRIDPVPLVSPAVVPPPPELARDLHFNDWTLAFMRNQTDTAHAVVEINPPKTPQQESRWSRLTRCITSPRR